MSNEASEQTDILSEHLAARDESGRVVLQAALLATVYFEGAYGQSVRNEIVSICEWYFREWGQRLNWALNPDTELMEPFGAGKGSNPRAWLPALGEHEGYSLIFHSAEDARGAGAFSLKALGMEKRPFVELGYLRVSFPLLGFVEGPTSLPHVLLEISRRLRPVSGYGGIGIIESPSSVISSEYAPVVYQWANRFPGLEADYPVEHSIWLGQGRDGGKGGIKGGNWLTVLGDRYVQELGGASHVQTSLANVDERFVVSVYDGGLMIQAGPRPQLGDVQQNRWPDLYVKLAKFLRPIRVTQHCPFQYGGPGARFDLGRSIAWLRRFDAK